MSMGAKCGLCMKKLTNWWVKENTQKIAEECRSVALIKSQREYVWKEVI